MHVRVRKDDTVKVLSGKDRGKTGTVERVLPRKAQVVVTGLNMIKKHAKPRRGAPHGGIVTRPAPVPLARVMVVCPRCSKPSRVGVTIDKDGRRHRTCKRCGEAWASKEQS